MSVFESGLPPFGGEAAPPNTLVNLLMKVLFPHPESAASPITIVSPPEHVILLPLNLVLLLVFLLLLLKKKTCFWLNPMWVFVGVEIEHDVLRGWTVYTVHTAIASLSWF
ncbi:hypothetical protein Hanom_Chr04g00316221 [Helianthus anomalus]